MGNKLRNAYNKPPHESFHRKINMQQAAMSLPLTSSVSISTWKKGMVKKENISKYLLENPDFLDEFVMKQATFKIILEWSKTSEQHVKKDNQDVSEHCEFERHLRRMYDFVPLFLVPKQPLVSEVERMLTEKGYDEGDPPVNIESHLFSDIEIPRDKLNFVFMYMMEKLFGFAAFPKQEFACFIATVQANYFNQPYHNFHHAICHAQSMYWILRNSVGMFSKLEMKTLMIASICHDIGHPGFGEAFTKCAMSNYIYDVPTLEQYHTQILYSILYNKNSNIFSALAEEDFMEVLYSLRMCILSTYVNEFAQRLLNLKKILESEFDIKETTCRNEVKRVLMVICDFSATWKSWNVHKSIIWALYEEFHEQGEKMEKMGFTPPREYLKKNVTEIPRHQISFLEKLILPMFREAAKIFPFLLKAVEQVENNIKMWMEYL